MNKQNNPQSVVGQKFANSNREWHDLSFTHLASYAAGFQTPVAVIPLTGNSTVVLNMKHALQTNPTVTPVFDGMRVNVRAFFCPQRLYSRGLIGNNIMEVDEIEEVAIPTIPYYNGSGSFNYNSEVGTHIIMYGSLLHRLGYPAGVLGMTYAPLDPRGYIAQDITTDTHSNLSIGKTDPTTTFNLTPIAAYYDIFNHYLSNPQQMENVPVANFTTGEYGSLQFGYNGDLVRNVYDAIDWMRQLKGFVTDPSSGTIPSVISLFKHPSAGVFSGLQTGLFGPYGELTHLISRVGSPSLTYLEVAEYFCNKVSQLGLMPSLYMDDPVTTWLNSDDIDNLMSTPIVGDDVEGYRLAKTRFNRLLRTIFNGRKYQPWIEAHFGTNLKLADHPIFVGSDYFNITFSDVMNNSASSDGDGIPLGAAASRGQTGKEDREQISFTALEPGYLIVILDIVPYVSYTDFKPNWLSWKTLASFPMPEYSGRTFQDLSVNDVYHVGGSVGEEVIGKQPLYYDFMTRRDTLGGIFSGPLLETYTFKRKFDASSVQTNNPEYETVQDIAASTYINKLSYDYAFPDWGQNGGENIFIKSIFDLKVLQPIARQVINTRI